MQAGQSTAASMTVIEAQYAVFGIPSDLSSEDRAAFRQNIDTLYCSLSTTLPPGVSWLARQVFLSTLKSMWHELGGTPNDPGC